MFVTVVDETSGGQPPDRWPNSVVGEILPRKIPYEFGDITMVLGLRLHGGNPWVLERLQALGAYYDPAPHEVIVVDFGSEAPYQQQLQAVCEAHKPYFRYLRVADSGVYSAACARNRGAEAVRTELSFFCDVDCLGEQNLFSSLAKHANALKIGKRFDQLVVLPAYHLSARATAKIVQRPTAERPAKVAATMTAAVLSERGRVVEYVDPFSNFLMCRTDFFQFVGGYNENFRGHGSEDYEFLLRVAAEVRQLPLPEHPEQDRFSPIRNTFFYRQKPYEGFRRLGEVMAYPAEVAGLRIAHLHHPRGETRDDWYAQRDAGRKRFNDQLLPYLCQPARALAYDWLQRERRALVVLGPTRAAADLALPLRLQGYRLQPCVLGPGDTVADVAAQIASYDTVVVVEHDWSAPFEPCALEPILTGKDYWVISGCSDPELAAQAKGSGPLVFAYRYFASGASGKAAPAREGHAVFQAAASTQKPGTREPGLLFEKLPFTDGYVRRSALAAPFGVDCYTSGRLQLALCTKDVEHRDVVASRQGVVGHSSTGRRVVKLLRNPVRFFADSRSRPLRLLGVVMIAVLRRR